MLQSNSEAKARHVDYFMQRLILHNITILDIRRTIASSVKSFRRARKNGCFHQKLSHELVDSNFYKVSKKPFFASLYEVAHCLEINECQR